MVRADYRDPASLHHAYQGCERLLLISGLSIGERVPEHAAAIKAERASGVRHITYTSVGGVQPRNPTPSAAEHVATERLLWFSGLGFAALSKQMYAELMLDMVCDAALPSGRWQLLGERGHFGPVSRQDIAACAATILLDLEAHDRVAYEITDPERLTMRDLAAQVAQNPKNRNQQQDGEAQVQPC